MTIKLSQLKPENLMGGEITAEDYSLMPNHETNNAAMIHEETDSTNDTHDG